MQNHSSAVLLGLLSAPSGKRSRFATQSASDSLVTKGYDQLRRGWIEAAIKTLACAVQSNPDNLQARRYLAVGLLKKGLAKQCADHMEVVIRKGIGQPLDQISLGEAYFQLGNHKSALECYRQALSSQLSSHAARVGVVRCLFALKQYDRADEECIQGLEVVDNQETRSEFDTFLRRIRDPFRDEHEVQQAVS